MVRYAGLDHARGPAVDRVAEVEVIDEITDSTIIVIFAQIRRGKVEDGLKAVAFVKPR